MRITDKKIYNTDQSVLVTLREEYISLGFDTSLELGCLTVHSRKKSKKQKRKEREERESQTRDKRKEKFERR